MDNNYYQTFITVADDCPVTESVVPEERGGKKTVARLHYELLADRPYEHTQEDVLFNTWLARQDLPPQSPDGLVVLREEFFSQPKPCLRTSPLAKKYGWGFHFDEQGRVALLPVESGEYRARLESGDVKIYKAMRSSRG